MKMRKLLSALLALAMLLSMTAAFAEETAEDTSRVTEDGSMPLVVATSTLSEKFSTFFADTSYDVDAVGLTSLSLATLDRVGAIVYNGIEGETIPYNGTDYTYYGPANLSVEYDEEADITTYTAKLREDLVFSDGEPLTADDVIFTYYVYLDPAYVGSTSLKSYKIVGLQDYLTQIPTEIYDKYNVVVAAIYAAGEGYTVQEGDSFTQEQYDAFWAALKANWIEDTGVITAYCVQNYLADYAENKIGFTPDEVTADEGLQTAFGMIMWGFGSVAEGVLTGAVTGTTWDLAAGERPTPEDYYNECHAAYAGDPVAYFETEAADDTDVYGTTVDAFISDLAANEPALADGIPNISGITKLDDYTVQVQTYGFEAPAVYSILGITITPMHYYGDPAQYDYANNQFGHPYGDLSVVESKTSQPVGAGPYKFVKYENRVVYYEANEHYFLGAPATKYFQYKETNSAEVATALKTGVVDGGEMSGSKDNFNLLKSYNTNGEATGDVVTTYAVAFLGYGYIGMNADTINVAGEPGSEASKNLRKGLATVVAVYRDAAYESHYGDAADVIQYPISSTSWAAPQPTDDDYKIAFSTAVDGTPIYTSDMTDEDKYAAAIEACKNYLIAAGYTFDEATGKFTAAPEGAKLAYEVIIPGDGIGDHPSFAVLTSAKAAFQTLGLDLIINDPADSNVLWDTCDAGTQEMWCAAWGATPDPDMYQVYFSGNIVGKGGTDSNHYHIQSELLDSLIIDARQSSDQAYRKATYKAALDEIVDWAVEIPAYQRQNIAIASSERVDISTVTPDVTTYWSWLAEIHTIKMIAE